MSYSKPMPKTYYNPRNFESDLDVDAILSGTSRRKLQCPLCIGFISEPKFYCAEGRHFICSKCYKFGVVCEMEKCGLCDSEIHHIRTLQRKNASKDFALKIIRSHFQKCKERIDLLKRTGKDPMPKAVRGVVDHKRAREGPRQPPHYFQGPLPCQPPAPAFNPAFFNPNYFVFMQPPPMPVYPGQFTPDFVGYNYNVNYNYMMEPQSYYFQPQVYPHSQHPQQQFWNPY